MADPSGVLADWKRGPVGEETDSDSPLSIVLMAPAMVVVSSFSESLSEVESDDGERRRFLADLEIIGLIWSTTCFVIRLMTSVTF